MSGRIIATGEESEHYMDVRNKYVGTMEHGTNVILAMIEDQLWDATPGSAVDAGWKFIKDCVKHCRDEMAQDKYNELDSVFVDPYIEFIDDEGDDWMHYGEDPSN